MMFFKQEFCMNGASLRVEAGISFLYRKYLVDEK